MIRKAPSHADASGGAAVSGAGAHRRALALLAVHLASPLALAAAAAVASARAAGCRLDPVGLSALGCGVGLAYVTDRLREGEGGLRASLVRRARLPLLACAAVLTAGLAASAVAAPQNLPLLAVLSALAVSHGVMARVPGAKTLTLALAWGLGPTLLPVPASAHPRPAFGCGMALLAASAGILCDLKDAAADRASGAWSLPAAFGPGLARAGAAAVAGAAAGVGLTWGLRPLVAGGVVLLGLATWTKLLERELLGPVAVDLGLALALLLA